MTHVEVYDSETVYVNGARYVRAILCGDCKYMGRFKKKYLCIRNPKDIEEVGRRYGCAYGVNESTGRKNEE